MGLVESRTGLRMVIVGVGHGLQPQCSRRFLSLMGCIVITVALLSVLTIPDLLRVTKPDSEMHGISERSTGLSVDKPYVRQLKEAEKESRRAPASVSVPKPISEKGKEKEKQEDKAPVPTLAPKAHREKEQEKAFTPAPTPAPKKESEKKSTPAALLAPQKQE